MGLWGKMFGNSLFTRRNTKKASDATKYNSGRDGNNVFIQWYFGNKTYAVKEFDLTFSQDKNVEKHSSVPLPETIIKITISDIPDDKMNWWIIDSFHKYDGEFRFFKDEELLAEGASLFIQFRDAHCIHYKKVIDPKKGALTTLTIQPRVIKVGNEEFEHDWR